MVNEEVMNEAAQSLKEAVTISIKVIRETKNLEKAAKEQMKKMLESTEKGIHDVVKGNEVKLKDLYKKGQLENIDVDKAGLKSLKKELNRNGVKFSVMRDKASGDYSLFFQANARKVIEQAFKNVLYTEKERSKPSTIKKLKECKERVDKDVSKDIQKDKKKVKAANRTMAAAREMM